MIELEVKRLKFEERQMDKEAQQRREEQVPIADNVDDDGPISLWDTTSQYAC